MPGIDPWSLSYDNFIGCLEDIHKIKLDAVLANMTDRQKMDYEFDRLNKEIADKIANEMCDLGQEQDVRGIMFGLTPETRAVIQSFKDLPPPPQSPRIQN